MPITAPARNDRTRQAHPTSGELCFYFSLAKINFSLNRDIFIFIQAIHLSIGNDDIHVTMWDWNVLVATRVIRILEKNITQPHSASDHVSDVVPESIEFGF